MRVFLWILAGLFAIGALKAVTKPTLNHFTPLEFGPWWLVMSNDLLVKLDEFRERWGAPVSISAATGALGREIQDEEPNSATQHNVLRWGEVRAADVIPKGMDTGADRQRAYRIARDIGFTGIGVYPDWKPGPGLHLDVRSSRQADNPSLWTGLNIDGSQQYVAIDRGFI